MHTIDEITIHGSMDRAFDVASDVERWPHFLPHYRWVKMLEPQGDTAVVEMAAWRSFGVVKCPTWWVSEMEIRPDQHQVRYVHIQGITTGMDVVWQLTDRGGHVDIAIVHTWSGPPWPLISSIAADMVIGPVFIHSVASRTLQGVKREVERA